VMPALVVTLLIVGISIMVVVGGGLSWAMEASRRGDMRRRSAREAAARFRSRFGSNADRAVAKMLDSSNISSRKRRFFNLIASELRSQSPQPSEAPPPGAGGSSA
jgi:hypothetical protein